MHSHLGQHHPRRGGATDIAVVALCALVLFSLIPVAILHMREQVHQQHQAEAMHQIGRGLQTYHQIWERFPRGGVRIRPKPPQQSAEKN